MIQNGNLLAPGAPLQLFALGPLISLGDPVYTKCIHDLYNILYVLEIHSSYPNHIVIWFAIHLVQTVGVQLYPKSHW